MRLILTSKHTELTSFSSILIVNFFATVTCDQATGTDPRSWTNEFQVELQYKILEG